MRLPVLDLDAFDEPPNCFGTVTLTARQCERCLIRRECLDEFGRINGVYVLSRPNREQTVIEEKPDEEITQWGRAGVEFGLFVDVKSAAVECGLTLTATDQNGFRLVGKRDGKIVFGIVRADSREFDCVLLGIEKTIAKRYQAEWMKWRKEKAWRIRETANPERGVRRLRKMLVASTFPR